MYSCLRLLILALALSLAFMRVLGDPETHLEETNISSPTEVSPIQTEVDDSEKQGYGPSTERNCIANGRGCELLVQHRLCCSGNPCQVVPSQILQLFTLGGWGICH